MDNCTERWKVFENGKPPATGYYRVRDHQGNQCVAFMHRNRTWTIVDGSVTKPWISWAQMQ